MSRIRDRIHEDILLPLALVADLAVEAGRLLFDEYILGAISALSLFSDTLFWIDLPITLSIIFLIVYRFAPRLFAFESPEKPDFRRYIAIYVVLVCSPFLVTDAEFAVAVALLFTAVGFIWGLALENYLNWRNTVADSLLVSIIAYSFVSIDPYLSFLEAIVLLIVVLRLDQYSETASAIISALDDRVLSLNRRSIEHPHGIFTTMLIYAGIFTSSQILVVVGALSVIRIFDLGFFATVIATLSAQRVGYLLVSIWAAILAISMVVISLAIAIFWIGRLPRIIKYIQFITYDSPSSHFTPTDVEPFPRFTWGTFWFSTFFVSLGVFPVRSLVNVTLVNGQLVIPYQVGATQEIGAFSSKSAISLMIPWLFGVFLLKRCMQSRDPAPWLLGVSMRNTVIGEHGRTAASYVIMIGILGLIGFVMKTTLMYEVLGLFALLILFMASHYRLKARSRKWKVGLMLLPTPIILLLLFFDFTSAIRIGQTAFLVVIGLLVSWGVAFTDLTQE